MSEDWVANQIVDSSMRLHKALGPGLFESVYETLLERELVRRGLRVQRQKPVDFEFEGTRIERGFTVDLLVDDLVIVELKSIEKLGPVHAKQLITYMRLMDIRVGLLINFGGATLREGLHRFVNQYTPSFPFSSRLGAK